MPPFCEQCQSYIQYSPCGTKGSCRCPGQPLAGLAPNSPTPAPVAERAREWTVDELRAEFAALPDEPIEAHPRLKKYRDRRMFVYASGNPVPDKRDEEEAPLYAWFTDLKAKYSFLLSLLATTPPDDPALDATDAAHPAWWRGQEHGARAVARMWTETLDGQEGGVCDPAIQEPRERTRAARAENQRLREDLQIARAEGIRWANAAEVEQGRRESADGESHRLCAIACREVCDCPFGSESDLTEADQMDPENHTDDCAWRLLREAWDEDTALAGRGQRRAAGE